MNYWDIFSLIIAFFVSCVTTGYLIPLLQMVARRLNIVDVPDGRLKMQRQPVPYLGGLAVYLGFILGIAFMVPFKNNLLFMFIGATLLVCIGLIDDLVAMRPHQKFFGQVIAALCFLKGGFYLKETFLFSSHSWLSFSFWLLISFFWILSVINAFNLVDIMDGLATTIALCSASAFLILASLFSLLPIALILASLLGALSAFLWFNRPPATIYLGDSGSLSIGGILAIVPFMFPWGTFSAYGYLTPVIILLIPLLEVATLVIIRTWQGIPFYQGSPHHFALYLKKRGWATSNILMLTILFCFLFSLIATLFCLGRINVANMISLVLLIIFVWIMIIFFPKIS